MAGVSVEAFCRALWKGDSDTIAAGAKRVDPNGADRWGYTPLTMAARYGDLALVSLLVDRGAAVDQGKTHLTPVTYAARRGASEIVAFLRAQGAQMSIVTWTYLGEVAQVRAALRRDPGQAGLRDEEGAPLIHHAAAALHGGLVRLLMKHGADVNETDEGGGTALHRVADLRGGPGPEAATMATLLIDGGAEVDARNHDDVTPLHRAVRARNLPVAEVLLARGADPNARDKGRGSTPLRRAVSGTGASGTAGTAALMVPLTRLLLQHGADPGSRDKRGVTVRASARDPKVVAVLEEYRRKAKGKAK